MCSDQAAPCRSPELAPDGQALLQEDQAGVVLGPVEAERRPEAVERLGGALPVAQLAPDGERLLVQAPRPLDVLRVQVPGDVAEAVQGGGDPRPVAQLLPQAQARLEVVAGQPVVVSGDGQGGGGAQGLRPRPAIGLASPTRSDGRAGAGEQPGQPLPGPRWCGPAAPRSATRRHPAGGRPRPDRARRASAGPGGGCRAPGRGCPPRPPAPPPAAPARPPRPGPGSTRRGAPAPPPSPPAGQGSRPYSRTVSSRANRGSPSGWVIWRSRLFSTSDARPSAHRVARVAPPSAGHGLAASSVQPPAKTARRRKRACSAGARRS